MPFASNGPGPESVQTKPVLLVHESGNKIETERGQASLRVANGFRLQVRLARNDPRDSDDNAAKTFGYTRFENPVLPFDNPCYFAPKLFRAHFSKTGLSELPQSNGR